LRLDIHQAGLSKYAELAGSRGIEIYQHDTFFELVHGQESVRISRGHAVYLRGMLLRFDYYFSAVEPYFMGELAVADYSSPRYHRLIGFDDFPAFFHSYPEPMSSSAAYLDFAGLKPGDFVLDLGAYAGMASILFSKAVGSEGIVVSYEPDPFNYQAALRNTALHAKLSRLTNIRLHNQAIWKDQDGIEFSCDGNMGSSAAQIVGQRGQVKEVETTTLAGILNDNQLDRVDFLKIDIEGAEIEVIKHSLDLLRALRPAIVMESHRVNNVHSAVECAELLSGISYTVWTSDGCSDYLLFAR